MTFSERCFYSEGQFELPPVWLVLEALFKDGDLHQGVSPVEGEGREY